MCSAGKQLMRGGGAVGGCGEDEGGHGRSRRLNGACKPTGAHAPRAALCRSCCCASVFVPTATARPQPLQGGRGGVCPAVVNSNEKGKEVRQQWVCGSRGPDAKLSTKARPPTVALSSQHDAGAVADKCPRVSSVVPAPLTSVLRLPCASWRPLWRCRWRLWTVQRRGCSAWRCAAVRSGAQRCAAVGGATARAAGKPPHSSSSPHHTHSHCISMSFTTLVVQ